MQSLNWRSILKNELPRDILINEIFNAAKNDRKIIFISADLGAKALDRFRVELPEQFLFAGISEQNMIDVAAGLAMNGFKVFCYAMAPFITSRCLEQIKVAIACQNLPVSLIGVGIGLGYDNAGPTHYAPEDIALMSTMGGINIYTPGDEETIKLIVKEQIRKPVFSYIRIERKAFIDLKIEKRERDFNLIKEGEGKIVISSGYFKDKLNLILKTKENNFSLLDLWKTYPINIKTVEYLKKYNEIIVIEEHYRSGGVGSKILEAFNDTGINKKITRIGLPKKYFFENGGRDSLLSSLNLGDKDLEKVIFKEEGISS